MKKILIVEDEKALVEVLRDEFNLHKYTVVVAYNGEEAMEKIQKEKPDFVLLDLLLPRKDGFEVLKEIKEDRELRHIPVLVLSNLGQDDDIKKALGLGAVDYFVKTQHPIKEVIEKVQHYIVQGISR
ncbi:MAG: response regulator [Methylococcaceae bacterium]